MLAVLATGTLLLTLPATAGASGTTAGPTVTGPATAATTGNAVLDWNGYAETAIVTVARQFPDRAAVSFAMVHGAVYDAVNSIARTHEPYLVTEAADPRASQNAAAATAAYQVLCALFPDQDPTLKPQYDASLAAVPDGPTKAAGIAAGERAAAAMLAARENDGRNGNLQWRVGADPGQWRPEPPFFATPATLAQVRPFLIPNASRFRTSGPNALTSKAYARDYNEVKRVGSVNSTVRTPDQTDAARFWAGGGMHEQIMKSLALRQGLSVAATARLYAKVYLIATDALIACYDDKHHHSFWRPITAIREAGNDGNPRTAPEAGWTPLLFTPPFPDHPAGHTCVTSAIATTERDFFGTNRMSFSAFSPVSGTTRHFHRFSQLRKEVEDARVWAGVHFRAAETQGSALGENVAEWVLRRHFEPLR